METLLALSMTASTKVREISVYCYYYSFYTVTNHSKIIGLAIFTSYFLAFVFMLPVLLSDFNMFDVLYDMLVALVALCHL